MWFLNFRKNIFIDCQLGIIGFGNDLLTLEKVLSLLQDKFFNVRNIQIAIKSFTLLKW